MDMAKPDTKLPMIVTSQYILPFSLLIDFQSCLLIIPLRLHFMTFVNVIVMRHQTPDDPKQKENHIYHARYGHNYSSSPFMLKE
jgi:hypothetical protein